MRCKTDIAARWTAVLAVLALGLSACDVMDVELGTHPKRGVDGAPPTPDGGSVDPDAETTPPAPDATPVTSCTADGWCSFSGGISLNGIDLRAVWVQSSTDIYVVGTKGTILHHDGMAWSKMASKTTEDLNGIWAVAPNEIYVVGNAGTALRSDGKSWSKMDPKTTENLYGVAGWVYGVMGGLWVVGDQWTLMIYNDGPGWSGASTGKGAAYVAVWAGREAIDEDVYVLSSMGNVLHGGYLDIVAGFGCGSLNAIWGSDSKNILVVGNTGMVVRYDGTSWIKSQAGQKDLHTVWGSSGTDFFAAGKDGAILRFNGTTWSSMKSGTTQTLLSLSGSKSTVIAVGKAGTILRFKGP